MIRILILLIVAVAIVSSQLHVSAGWAWAIVLAALAAGGLWFWRNSRIAFVTPSAAWQCPFCRKRVKLGATVCHHCGRTLVRARTPPTAATPAAAAAAAVPKLDETGRAPGQATRVAAPSMDALDEPVLFLHHTRTFTNDDGHPMTGRGLWPALPRVEGFDDQDADEDATQWISYDSSTLHNRADLLHIHVAGIQYQSKDSRTSQTGSPPQWVAVIPEDNPHDRDALAIHTVDMSHQLGYVPRHETSIVRDALARGWQAMSVWEWRNEQGERSGMHVLIAAPTFLASLAEAMRGVPR